MIVLFSVIVPVYNGTQPYLRACIGSIVRQGFPSFELIIVDDASTDGSGALAAELAMEDGRAQLIQRRTHGGAGAARNTAIRAARGEYLLFVDADDLLEPGALQAAATAVEAAPAPDLAFLRGEQLYEKGWRVPFSPAFTGSELADKDALSVHALLAGLGKFPASPCDKAIRKEFLLEQQLFFPEGQRCEDLDFSMCLLLEAQYFAASKAPYYLYRKARPDSASKERSYPRALAYLRIMEKWLYYRDNGELAQASQDMISSFMAFLFPFPLMLYDRVLPGERAAFCARIEKLDKLLGKRRRRRDRLIRMAYRALGPERCGALLQSYVNWREKGRASVLRPRRRQLYIT